MKVLALNAGSSSVKAAVFEDGEAVGRGKVSRLRGDPVLDAGGTAEPLPRGTGAVEAALTLSRRLNADRPDVVAHRIVHGGDRAGPARMTDRVLADLAALSDYAPLHQPASLGIAQALRDAIGEAVHVACFDTAFHQTIDAARTRFAVGAELRPPGVRRYGFHGLSYEGTARWLEAERPDLSRVVIAHLGSGASLCALKDGRSVATTMSLTPLDGVPMGTRSGALDPGYLIYLMRQGMDADAIEDALYRRAGLLGLSGVSNDVRDLRASEAPEAAFALQVFTDSVAETVGAFAVALGGLDAIVFTGGIGENDPEMREAVVGRLAPLSPFEALVRPADEEAVMAAQALRLARRA